MRVCLWRHVDSPPLVGVRAHAESGSLVRLWRSVDTPPVVGLRAHAESGSLVRLWRSVDSPPVVGLRAHAAEGVAARLWTNAAVERRKEKARAVREMKRRMQSLRDEREGLLSRRRKLAGWRSRLASARKALKEGDTEAAEAVLRELVKEAGSEPLANRAGIAAALYQLCKNRGDVDGMFDVSVQLIRSLPCTTENLSLLHEVGILHRDAGDPALATDILRRVAAARAREGGGKA